MADPVSWRRNQFAVTAASFVGFAGFTLVMPFLPLYIRELGVSDVGEIALWTGLSLGATPAVTAVLSPFWGRVADRFGRKLMVQRSLLSFVIIMAAMAMVTRAWHIFALRVLLGLFAGYGGLTMAMAAESAPRDRMARAIGLVQTAQRIGPALGPVIGGIVAGLVGVRHAFFVTSGFYVIALAVVTVLYRDPAPTVAEPSGTEGRASDWRTLLRAPGFAAMIATIFVLTFVDRSFSPILPLWIESRGVPPGQVALVAGALFSAAAFGAAVGNSVCDVLLRRRAAARLIEISAWGGGIAMVLFLVVRPPAWLAASMAGFGLALGIATTAAYTEGGRKIPPAMHGEGFGLLNAGSLAGLALSPMAAGVLSKGSLLWVFGIDLALLALLPYFLRRTAR